MKFVTFLDNRQEKVGLVLQDSIYDLTQINHNLPSTLIDILADDDFSLIICQQITNEISRGEYKKYNYYGNEVKEIKVFTTKKVDITTYQKNDPNLPLSLKNTKTIK